MTASDVARACEAAASEGRFPDGQRYRQLRVDAAHRVADAVGVHIRDVEISALRSNIIPERYERNFQSFSTDDQCRLLESRAAVIGLGGLGGTVVEILARIGVGYLRLVDGDRFEGHNLNRQLLATMSEIGRLKAETAGRRAAAVNPSVVVETVASFLDSENAESLITDTHVVIDCLDSIGSRFDLESACKQCGVPLVSAAIAGASGHVTSIFPGDPGLRIVYGTPGENPNKGAEATLGTLPPAVTTAASLESSEAVKILLNQGPLLRNRLLIFDVMAGIFETVTLST